jgi:DNA-binding CsgD family transcriptional regulator
MVVGEPGIGGLRLRGREQECAALDRLLEATRSGRSDVLVLHGEAGVGKTALLDYAIESASDMLVVRAAGVESEMELAFAALYQLCTPLLHRLVGLPAAQSRALAITFGLSEGPVPNRFLVALAVLGLLSNAAAERPVLCAIDDAQWLDRASADALTFVAHRLQAESVGMLFAAREAGNELVDLPSLLIGGLRDADARSLLASVIPGRLDERVVDRLVAETRGNPLALLELPSRLTARLAGGFGLPGALSLEGRIEESYLERLEGLPRDTRQLLVVAAADPTGDPALLRRAAERLGIDDPTLESAESAGLVQIGTTVRFRHPLARSAVYRAASAGDRRLAHLALAEATDPDRDPDRRAWHRAKAVPAADEDLATELEHGAARAQRRGGLAAAAAFLELAAARTTDPARRSRRALAAAEAKHNAGDQDAALGLLRAAEAGQLDTLGRARVDLLRARVAFAVKRGRDAPALLLNAARRLEALDVALARQTYLDALSAATLIGPLSREVGVLDVARAALAAPPPPAPPRAGDLLLDGLSRSLTEGPAAGAPTLKRALEAFRGEELSDEEGLRWSWLAAHAALDLWDDESWEALAIRHVQLVRDAGALAMLPIALNTRIGAHLAGGEFAAGRSLSDEVRTVCEATGIPRTPYIDLTLAAFEGREADASAFAREATREATATGEGIGLTISNWAIALLYNGLGRYDDAFTAAQLASEHPQELRFATRGLVELIEAAARSGRHSVAAEALERLSETTRASGTDLALGTEARSRAMLSGGAAADNLYQEAIDRLRRTRVSTARARAHLIYGEWLRRERRRREAREQLRTAYQMLSAMGLGAFAQRAERELLATGESVRKRVVETRDELTAQEAQIARLARDGLSNAEIGERLFLSPQTAGYHLRKVFAKLGITSRHQLDRTLDKRATAGGVI